MSRPKFSKPSGNKQWITYGIVAVCIGTGLYLNFNGTNDSQTSPAETKAPTPLPVAENAEEEPQDSSLLPPVYSEEEIAKIALENEQENAADSSRFAGSTLDESNPMQLWQEDGKELAQTMPAQGEERGLELGEMAEHETDNAAYADSQRPVTSINPTVEDDAIGNTTGVSVLDDELTAVNAQDSQVTQPETTTVESDMLTADDSTALASDSLSSDIERLSLNRSRIEQSVRRGQIPPTQRDEILRSEEFNAVIAAIGRRVGEAWYYEGDDHLDHGAILGIELGSGGIANDVSIRRSSGNERYNMSVLDAANSSAPFIEVDALTSTAQTLLNPFSLTFGSMQAIQAYEASWPRQDANNPSDTEGEDGNDYENRNVAAIKRTIRANWPTDFQTGVDHDISLQLTLAVPMGNIADVEFLRNSNNVDLNDQIYQLVRSMPAFSGLSELSLQEQNEVRQFNLHISPDGSLR